ncbi:MAG: LTA synthase family protein [Caulobacteraceae bacterium]
MPSILISKHIVQQSILMLVFTFSKIILLYFLTSLPQYIVFASLRTLAALMFIYVLLNFFLFRRSFPLRLLFHELFTLIVVADLLYYRFFEVLPSVNDLILINVVPSILNSIEFLFKQSYLLLFVDLIILPLHKYILFKPVEAEPVKLKAAAIFAFLIGMSLFTDAAMSKYESSGQIYNNCGIIHYHADQIKKLVEKTSYTEESEKKQFDTNEQQLKKASEAKYFGIAEGRNVIVIQVEALQDFVINRIYNGQELTPNLNSLIKKDTIYFNHYYQQLGKGNTSDAEFVSQNSMYPSMDIPAYRKYENNKFMGMPMILRNKGYVTKAFHGYKAEFWNRVNMYPMMGFDYFVSMNDFRPDEKIGWGISDKAFFKKSAEILSTTKQPFYAFNVTLTSHHPYVLPDKYKKIELYDEHYTTLLGRYLQVINYTDEAIGLYIQELKKYGLYENSIIAIYGDHGALSCSDPLNKRLMTGLLGYEYNFDESLNVPLLIHIPGSGIRETNTIAGGQLDFLPTMLNLLGIKENRVKLFGQDLNNAESGFVASQTKMEKGSFIDDEKIFVMSSDGIFEHSKAWDLKTRLPIDLELCRDGYEKAVSDINESEYILSNNLIEKFITETADETTFGRSLRASAGFLRKVMLLLNRLFF